MLTGLGTAGNFITTENRVGVNFDFGCNRTYTGTLEDSFNATEAADDVGKRVSVYSMKTGGPDNPGAQWRNYSAITTEVRQWANSVPANHKVYFSIQHEPEDQGKETINYTDGKIMLGTALEYKTMQTKVREVIDDVNAGRDAPYKIGFGGTLMAQSATRTANGKKWCDIYYPGKSVWNWVAWDGYCWYNKPWRTCESIFDDCAAWCKAKGIGWAVSEVGIGYTHPNRAGWIAAGIKWSRSNGGLWWCYWDNSNNTLETDAEFHALAT